MAVVISICTRDAVGVGPQIDTWATCHRQPAAARGQKRPMTYNEAADVVLNSTLDVRKAALFGEAIIVIVYIPILTLAGIEGKMFKPMAITVLFALLGAFVASLTFVPVL